MYKGRIIDCHLHMETDGSMMDCTDAIIRETGASALCILGMSKGIGRDKYFIHETALAMKKKNPGQFFAFTGIDYSNSDFRKGIVDFGAQAKAILEAGFDGIKMIEGKPDTRKILGIPLNSQIFDSFYAFMQAKRFPLIMHVADPETFWDRNLAPESAFKHGWFWGDGTFVSKEQLQAEALAILDKFPGLNMVFAHFFFLSGDIGKASETLDKYPNLSYDITPGTEMYVNFSRNAQEWRRFFIKYQDRLLFGTDNSIRIKTGDDTMLRYMIDKTLEKRRFLETDDKMFSGEGLKLENGVLEKIYCKNFLALMEKKRG